MYQFRNNIGDRVEYRPTRATAVVLAQESLSWCLRITWDATGETEWIRDSDVFPVK